MTTVTMGSLLGVLDGQVENKSSWEGLSMLIEWHVIKSINSEMIHLSVQENLHKEVGCTMINFICMSTSKGNHRDVLPLRENQQGEQLTGSH